MGGPVGYPLQNASSDSSIYQKNDFVNASGEKILNYGDNALSYSSDEGIDKKSKTEYTYTKEQYDNFGWAHECGALNFSQLEDLDSKIQERKSLKSFPHQSYYGETIIAVNSHPRSSLEFDNALVFVTGTKGNHKITKVIKIALFNKSDLEEVIKELYEREQFRPWTSGAFANYFEDGFIVFYRDRDFKNYQKYKADREFGGIGRESAGNSRDIEGVRNGGRNTLKGESDEVKFSYTPETEQDLTNLVSNGEITVEEYGRRMLDLKQKIV